MNRPVLIALIFCLLASSCKAYQSTINQQAPEKPHVLLIYTDDHRYSGVHALAGQPVQTPNLDQLAESGIAFTQAHLMGSFSGATCIPSRAMLHTGRDLFHLDGIGHNIPDTHTTIGEVFGHNEYHTHHIGKWHQDFGSLARSFKSGGKVVGKPRYLTDQFRMPYSDWQKDGNYLPENCYLLEYDESGAVARRPIAPTDKRGPIGTEETGPHVSEVLADEAVGFIQAYDENVPFFMYLAFPTPHDPRQAPRQYLDMYPVDEVELTPSYMPQHPFDNGHIVLRDELLATWPRTPEIARKHLAEYYAIITHLDAQIGRVIEALKSRGLYENTLIVMAGDSGLGVGNHGLLGKQNVYEEDGLHMPLIFSGGALPNEGPGRRIDALCYIHDIMPTICGLADIPIPETVMGKSLLPLINAQTDQIRDHTYHAYRQHQRAYRKEAYKLIEYVRAPDQNRKGDKFIAGSRVTQLFNIEADPWETMNLADFPEHKTILEAMRAEMKAQSVELGDVADGKRTEVDFWDFY